MIKKRSATQWCAAEVGAAAPGEAFSERRDVERSDRASRDIRFLMFIASGERRVRGARGPG